LFRSGAYGHAVERLRELVARGQGLVTLTGEPGSGKSTVLRALSQGSGNGQSLACIWQPDLPISQLLHALHEQFGLPSQGPAGEPLKLIAGRIAEERRRGRQVLIMIDDAHTTPVPTLHQLQQLAKLQPAPLVLLAGEPQLLELLDRGTLDEPTAAIRNIRLPNLEPSDTEVYVPAKLQHAGAADAALFEPAALSEIHDFTGGVPALIDVLCDAAMHQAMGRFSHSVGQHDVIYAARSLNWISDEATAELTATRRVLALLPPPSGDTTPTLTQPGEPPLVRVTRREEAIAEFRLGPGPFVIGRALDCNLRLDGNFVSRHHCAFVSDAGDVLIEDLGSTNGIAINGSDHQSGLRHALKPGDYVRIGDYTLTFIG
jgi:type II secretory pathway predicted ATPase ExeA